jgi:hypothetical protein
MVGCISYVGICNENIQYDIRICTYWKVGGRKVDIRNLGIEGSIDKREKRGGGRWEREVEGSLNTFPVIR